MVALEQSGRLPILRFVRDGSVRCWNHESRLVRLGREPARVPWDSSPQPSRIPVYGKPKVCVGNREHDCHADSFALSSASDIEFAQVERKPEVRQRKHRYHPVKTDRFE